MGTGLIAAIASDLGYWNWWAFPGAYIFSNIGIDLVAFLAAGIAIAVVLPKPQQT